MPLMTCPECAKPDVSDTARACPNCGYDLAAYFRKRKEEQERRDAEELEARRLQDASRANTGTILSIVGVILFFIILAASSNQNQAVAAGTTLFSVDRQTGPMTTDQQTTFNASGKVQIVYSCSGNSGSVQFKMFASSVDTSGSPIWQQAIKCPANKTDTITSVPAISYYLDVQAPQNTTWSVKVTQE